MKGGREGGREGERESEADETGWRMFLKFYVARGVSHFLPQYATDKHVTSITSLEVRISLK